MVNRLLTTPESDKEVRHYEVDLSGSGIAYNTGDSIAVHASNDPALVDAILGELGGSRTRGRRLRRATRHAAYRAPRDPDTVARVADIGRRPNSGCRRGERAGRRSRCRTPGSWLYGKDVLDLIRLGELTVDEVVDTLRPLQSRDYSIASSPLVHPDQVHLTVATVRYSAGDRQHGGVASTFLSDRSQTVRVQLRPNHSFRLPAADVPVIMIGPGTGIAPFRGFLQERQAVGATGRSWLFFGDRRRAATSSTATSSRASCSRAP